MPKFFKVAVSLSLTGKMNIEAETLEEAIQIAQKYPDIQLPEGEYVGSFDVDYEMTKELNRA